MQSDYSRQAIIDRLNHAKKVYENAGNTDGIEAATEAISRHYLVYPQLDHTSRH